MIALNKITSSSRSLTLAGVAAGFLPWLLADLTRAAKGRLVYIAPDDAAMSKVGEAAKFFAPEIDVIEFSAWDCLPYDRASPSLRTTSERLAALHDLQFGKKKSTLVLTTINAVTQRIITPFRIRALGTRLSPGKTIDRDQ